METKCTDGCLRIADRRQAPAARLEEPAPAIEAREQPATGDVGTGDAIRTGETPSGWRGAESTVILLRAPASGVFCNE